ncbi:MAG: Acylneuraminate cytidylyltransferase [Parcubacteria group bacterium GW2011_GWA2_47_64]|nr:MAG: Acylneuraminate cytidylyltransferase [Parcubacteria group bacterium GW2011_GWA2_47_64]KKU96550.1 MAG: Acylneuraminate cytidylyltransferase [Parcubacteria group bacterium GW2011_GWC2_48_17]
MNSKRLPGKVLKDLCGKPLLWHVAVRAKKSKLADKVIVATSAEKSDDPIVALCESEGVKCYRGSLDNVLLRYVGAARESKATTIVRVTADCPLIDPDIIDRCITSFETSGADYVSNVHPEPNTFPRGFDVEVFSLGALEKAEMGAKETYDKEHVTPFILKNKGGEFVIGPTVTASPEYARSYRLCVDYEEDYALMERIYKQFYKEGEHINVPALLTFLDAHPEWLA